MKVICLLILLGASISHGSPPFRLTWPSEFRPAHPKGDNNTNPVAFGIYYDSAVMNVPLTLTKPLIMPPGTSVKVEGPLTVVGMVNVNGDMSIVGNATANSFVSTSDRRLKKDIVPIEDAVKKISQLRGVNFTWRNEKYGSKRQLGFLAQDVEIVFPEVVHENHDGYKGVAYSQLVVPLVEAIKEQERELESLREQNKDILARLEELEKNKTRHVQ